MKIYLHDKGIICTGKAWQIRHLLKKYTKDYTYVKEWLEYVEKQTKKYPSSKK
ncbi:Z-ring formation inhibitor MciZ [Niallia sp. 01092]|uniref:Z-ring formation inhibitor MciZ n=1 Tax=unclassified Niallia TaxID=2837522 RepID=UPI003FD35D16